MKIHFFALTIEGNIPEKVSLRYIPMSSTYDIVNFKYRIKILISHVSNILILVFNI
jgi:hypothetical protein